MYDMAISNMQMTINIPKERSKAIMEDVTQFLKSTELIRVFHVLDLTVSGVEVRILDTCQRQIDKVLIQDNSDPFTCYNNRLDDDETDVDCGGSSCSSRCPASAKFSSDSDCDDMSCFRGKCTNINWMRIFYIAGIAVAVIVVIAVVSVCVAAIRKKKNVDILNITHSLGSNDGNSSFANSSGLPCLLLC